MTLPIGCVRCTKWRHWADTEEQADRMVELAVPEQPLWVACWNCWDQVSPPRQQRGYA